MRRSKQSLSMDITTLNTHDALRYNWMCWRLLGMHPFHKHQPIYWIYSWLLNFFSSVIYISTYFVPFFLPHDDSFALLSTLFPMVSSTMKHAVLFYHLERNLSKAAQHLHALDRRAAGNSSECAYLMRQIRQCHLIFYAGAVSYFVCLTLFAILNATHKILPFEGWMPFDWQGTKWIYLIVSGVQFFCMAVRGASSTCSDTYSVIYLKLLRAHLCVLNGRIASLGEAVEVIENVEQRRVEMYEELAACVQDHRECIHYFNCICPAISATLCVAFCSAASVLCSAAVRSVQAGLDFQQVMKFLTYVVLTLVQIAPCCFYMDEIRAQLNELTTSLYSCRWYDQDRKFRCSLIIFMQRTQKVENMLAANIVPVSLDTFVAILKFTFSLFTLLNNHNKRNNGTNNSH